MWYEDLTECDYLGQRLAKYLTAIGWLEKGKDFQTGTFSPKTYSKLLKLDENYWMFAVHAGSHSCDLCGVIYRYGIEGFPKVETGEVLIPESGKIYVYPKLMIHYIEKHHYLPPKEFIDAVNSCPPMKSIRYFAKLTINVVRKLLITKKGKKIINQK